MGVAFPLVQSFHGKVLHECIQGTSLSFLLLPALPPSLSLFLFHTPFNVSHSALRLPLSLSFSFILSFLFLWRHQRRLPLCFFVARACHVEFIDTPEHPLVIVVANPSTCATARVLSLTTIRRTYDVMTRWIAQIFPEITNYPCLPWKANGNVSFFAQDYAFDYFV